MIILDASVLIAHLDEADAHHDRATELLIITADETLGASPLTIAEVLVGPARAGTLDAARAALAALAVTMVPLAAEAPDPVGRPPGNLPAPAYQTAACCSPRRRRRPASRRSTTSSPARQRSVTCARCLTSGLNSTVKPKNDCQSDSLGAFLERLSLVEGLECAGHPVAS